MKNAIEVFEQAPRLTLGNLCEQAGFFLVYSGPHNVPGKKVSQGARGRKWETRRPNLNNFPIHLVNFLERIDASQSPYAPEEHFLYARQLGKVEYSSGVEMFHFWDGRVWNTKGQTFEKGLAYCCLPNAEAVALEIAKVEERGNSLILLDEQHIYPDKWDFQALERLMWYAHRLGS